MCAQKSYILLFHNGMLFSNMKIKTKIIHWRIWSSCIWQVKYQSILFFSNKHCITIWLFKICILFYKICILFRKLKVQERKRTRLIRRAGREDYSRRKRHNEREREDLKTSSNNTHRDIFKLNELICNMKTICNENGAKRISGN